LTNSKLKVTFPNWFILFSREKMKNIVHSRWYQIVLFLLMAYVIVAGITFPIVAKPSAWYEFPLIMGTWRKCQDYFLSCAQFVAFGGCFPDGNYL
jgi:hypothetical protein